MAVSKPTKKTIYKNASFLALSTDFKALVYALDCFPFDNIFSNKLSDLFL